MEFGCTRNIVFKVHRKCEFKIKPVTYFINIYYYYFEIEHSTINIL